MPHGDASSAAEGVADDGGWFVPELTRRLRAGDDEAFRWLHRHWNDRHFRYGFAVARGDGAQAGEIAQATYLRVARHMRELPDEALADLSDEHRLLIERRCFPRVPLEEIGGELGASARAVEGRLARVGAALRRRNEHSLSHSFD